jgi:hypothetical protein
MINFAYKKPYKSAYFRVGLRFPHTEAAILLRATAEVLYAADICLGRAGAANISRLPTAYTFHTIPNGIIRPNSVEEVKVYLSVAQDLVFGLEHAECTKEQKNKLFFLLSRSICEQADALKTKCDLEQSLQPKINPLASCNSEPEDAEQLLTKLKGISQEKESRGNGGQEKGEDDPKAEGRRGSGYDKT